ncbi:MAG: hypothetical protein AAF533_19765 [Acidobacteriota bacterium]
MEEIWAQHSNTIIGAVLVIALIFIGMKLFSPKKKVFAEDMTLNVKCKDCGWQGTVTKYNQVCRKCNSSNLEKM